MKIKTDVVLKNLDGQVMKDNDGKGNAVDATLKMAIVNAVLAPVQNEKGTDKIKKYELAMKVHKNKEVDLTAEDISLIKERVGELFPPLIVGQVYNLLEGKE